MSAACVRLLVAAFAEWPKHLSPTTCLSSLATLGAGQLYRFADWPNADIPNGRAGVYSVWDGDALIYVGMAGRGLVAGADEATAQAPTSVGSSSRPTDMQLLCSRDRPGAESSSVAGDRFSTRSPNAASPWEDVSR